MVTLSTCSIFLFQKYESDLLACIRLIYGPVYEVSIIIASKSRKSSGESAHLLANKKNGCKNLVRAQFKTSSIAGYVSMDVY